MQSGSLNQRAPALVLPRTHTCCLYSQSRSSFMSASVCMLCRAVSGAVLHIVSEDSNQGPSGSSQKIAYIGNSTFTDNHADASADSSVSALATFSSLQGTGGVISFFGSILWIQHSVFQDNSAGTLGGVMMVQQWCLSVSTPPYMDCYHALLG